MVRTGVGRDDRIGDERLLSRQRIPSLGHEALATGNTARAHTLSHFRLVLVLIGIVEKVIAHADSLGAAVIATHAEGAQSDRGDQVVVGESRQGRVSASRLILSA